jgi:hypothetical protein
VAGHWAYSHDEDLDFADERARSHDHRERQKKMVEEGKSHGHIHEVHWQEYAEGTGRVVHGW